MKTRSVERYLMLEPIRARLDPVGLAKLREISVEGACVEHLSRVALGLRVRLTVKLIPGTIPLTFDGVTVWSTIRLADGVALHRTGIRFDEDANALRSVLTQLCSHGVASVVGDTHDLGVRS